MDSVPAEHLYPRGTRLLRQVKGAAQVQMFGLGIGPAQSLIRREDVIFPKRSAQISAPGKMADDSRKSACQKPAHAEGFHSQSSQSALGAKVDAAPLRNVA